MLYDIHFKFFNFREKSNGYHWGETSIVGLNNAIFLAERTKNAENVVAIDVIDCLTGEIVWEWDAFGER